jgi:hypothetical protein
MATVPSCSTEDACLPHASTSCAHATGEAAEPRWLTKALTQQTAAHTVAQFRPDSQRKKRRGCPPWVLAVGGQTRRKGFNKL